MCKIYLAVTKGVVLLDNKITFQTHVSYICTTKRFTQSKITHDSFMLVHEPQCVTQEKLTLKQ